MQILLTDGRKINGITSTSLYFIKNNVYIKGICGFLATIDEITIYITVYDSFLILLH